MKQLKFDTGLVSYRLGEGVLRFNPADPNLYQRFQQAQEKLEAIGRQMEQQLDDQPVLTVMTNTDRALKSLLGWVFGPGNDFDALLGGVNLLSVDSKGQRLITGLLDMLEPVLLEGAQRCAQAQIQTAVDKANARRSAQ